MGAGDLGQRGAAAAARDGEPGGEGSADVGHAEDPQLGVGIDLLPLVGERPCVQGVVRERDQRDAHRGAEDLRQHGQVGGERQGRQAAGDLAHDGHPAVLQVQQSGDRGGAEDRQQRPGQLGGEAGADEQGDDHARADRQGGQVRAVSCRDRGEDLVDGVGPLDLHAEQLAELPGDHDDRDARQVAAEHWAAEQLGDEPHPQESSQQGEHAHDQCAHGGHRGVLARVTDS